MSATVEVPLRRVAHGRAGDKNGTVNISVIAFEMRCFEDLRRQVTAAKIRRRFAHCPVSAVRRYALAGIGALNFVIEGALGGGVNDSLRLDRHGKSLSYLVLDMPVRIPAHKLPGAVAAGVTQKKRRKQ